MVIVARGCGWSVVGPQIVQIELCWKGRGLTLCLSLCTGHETRPIRPTVRPHEDEMIVWFYNIVLDFSFDLLKYDWYDWSMDWLTDARIDLLIKMLMMHLVSLVHFLCQLFAQKFGFPLFLTKAWPTDGRTDGPTDGQNRL